MYFALLLPTRRHRLCGILFKTNGTSTDMPPQFLLVLLLNYALIRQCTFNENVLCKSSLSNKHFCGFWFYIFVQCNPGIETLYIYTWWFGHGLFCIKPHGYVFLLNKINKTCCWLFNVKHKFSGTDVLESIACFFGTDIKYPCCILQ